MSHPTRTFDTDTLAERLRGLDPAPAAALTHLEQHVSDERLARLTADGDTIAHTPARAPRRRLVTAAVLGTAAIGTVAAVAGISFIAPSHAPVANFALSARGALGSYTSTPVPIVPSSIDRDACGTASSEHGNTAAEAVLTSERRGDFRAMLFDDVDGRTAFCIVAGQAALWISNSDYLSTAPPSDLQLLPAPAANGITTDLGRADSPSSEFGTIISQSGRAGRDVASVALNFADGSTITAMVSHGHWAAWWPTSTDLGAEGGVDQAFPTSTTYTTTDGETQTVPAP